jgi:hypothetical protein
VDHSSHLRPEWGISWDKLAAHLMTVLGLSGKLSLHVEQHFRRYEFGEPGAMLVNEPQRAEPHVIKIA